MSELKPCPFCGRVPIVDDCGDNRFFVRCKCGIVQDKLYGQRCDAVRRWNTRRQQPERKSGKWIPQDMNKSNGMISTAVYYYPKCSVCGWNSNYTNFCPNCGADMRGENDATD